MLMCADGVLMCVSMQKTQEHRINSLMYAPDNTGADFVDELSGYLSSLNVKGGQMKSMEYRANLLTLHNGDSLANATVGRGGASVDKPHYILTGATQPNRFS